MRNDYIYEAVATFENTTGIPVNIESIRKDNDIMLQIKGEIFYGYARKTSRRTNYGIALPFIENKSTKNRILLVDYLTKKTAAYLKENKINYIDTAGNIYIDTKKLFVYTHSKSKDNKKSNNTTKAFQEAGLKLILFLLTNPESLDYSYRKLSEISDVSLGSISNIFDDLEKQNLLLKTKDKRILKNKDEIIERWTIAYNDILKPRIVRKKFNAIDKNFSTNDILKLNSDKTIYIGGEPGAQILTKNLVPKKYILFTSEDIGSIGKELKLIPNNNGDIEIYSPFWTDKLKLSNKRVAPPLVIYADLVNSGNHRNLEIAKMILDNEL